MKFKTRIARRQFLYGAGGFTLALPYLPSIEPRAFGQTVDPRRYFFAIGTNHGAIKPENMYPAATALTTKYDIYPGHTVSYGNLTRTVSGTRASVSPVLSAAATALTDSLVSKMNVLRGFGMPFNISHHAGGHLGNMAANTGQDADAIAMQKYPAPSIDQVMAWSPKFYPSLTGIKERAMLYVYGNPNSSMCYNYSDPAAKTGSIQTVSAYRYVDQLFNTVFVSGSTPTTPTTPSVPARKPIVDHVIENYRSLRDGNRRLSLVDKQRLEDHLTRLSELQRRISGMAPALPPPASCGDFKKPTNINSGNAEIKAYADVVACGMICGSSRIGAVGFDDRNYNGTAYASGVGSWHDEVAHNSTAAQDKLVAAGVDIFENVLVHIARALDADNGLGGTYLDNALVMWTQEAGVQTHDGTSIPVITFGSGGKFLNTGIYADYRNQVPNSKIVFQSSSDYAGLTWNHMLAIALQTMGIPRSDFETGGAQGYAHTYVAPSHAKAYVSGVVENSSVVPRPLLRV